MNESIHYVEEFKESISRIFHEFEFVPGETRTGLFGPLSVMVSPAVDAEQDLVWVTLRPANGELSEVENLPIGVVKDGKVISADRTDHRGVCMLKVDSQSTCHLRVVLEIGEELDIDVLEKDASDDSIWFLQQATNDELIPKSLKPKVITATERLTVTPANNPFNFSMEFDGSLNALAAQNKRTSSHSKKGPIWKEVDRIYIDCSLNEAPYQFGLLIFKEKSENTQWKVLDKKLCLLSRIDFDGNSRCKTSDGIAIDKTKIGQGTRFVVDFVAFSEKSKSEFDFAEVESQILSRMDDNSLIEKIRKIFEV